MGMAVLTSCGKKQQQVMPTANFETMKVAAKDLVVDQRYSATIRGRQDIEVYPQVGGTLQRLCVQEGQTVTKGQTLFIIDQVPYQAALNTAEAALKAAKAQEATAQLSYESKKNLREQNVISDFDLQTANNALLAAKAQVAQTEAQVTNARNSLSYTVVKSPANGVVGTLPYRQGALVSAQMPQPLTTVSDNNEMFVYFSMTERELLDLSRQYGSISEAIKNMPALTLQLVDGSEYSVKGKVESVSGVVDRSTGTVQLRAAFSNPDKLLRSGNTGTIVMPIESKGQLVVPVTATVQMQTKYKVYTVDDKNIAHERIISVKKLSNGKEYVVTEGLKAGETIVAKGAGMLKDGQDIKPNKE
ncbi:MAG: efflux RND transporter periplasmic adaptor subunit [Bacteroidaceae bacterium]|nr:efflux RND transporter periplasmic adaptor subunit [Bacteroidaceae bacterium]